MGKFKKGNECPRHLTSQTVPPASEQCLEVRGPSVGGCQGGSHYLLFKSDLQPLAKGGCLLWTPVSRCPWQGVSSVVTDTLPARSSGGMSVLLDAALFQALQSHSSCICQSLCASTVGPLTLAICIFLE